MFYLKTFVKHILSEYTDLSTTQMTTLTPTSSMINYIALRECMDDSSTIRPTYTAYIRYMNTDEQNITLCIFKYVSWRFFFRVVKCSIMSMKAKFMQEASDLTGTDTTKSGCQRAHGNRTWWKELPKLTSKWREIQLVNYDKFLNLNTFPRKAALERYSVWMRGEACSMSLDIIKSYKLVTTS